MKNFMLIFFGEDYSKIEWGPGEMQERMQKWGTWTQQIMEKGIFVDGQGLLNNTRTITTKDGVAKDGPYMDVKETVGGYYVIKAENIDAALEIARDYPDFDLGGAVEVRECMSENEGE